MLVKCGASARLSSGVKTSSVSGPDVHGGRVFYRACRIDAAYRHRLAVRFRDCDAMGHVNHAVYFTYLEQCRLTFWRELTGGPTPHTRVIVARAECDYRAPAHFGDELEIRLSIGDLGRTSFGLIYEIVNAATDQEARGRQDGPGLLRLRRQQTGSAARRHPSAARETEVSEGRRRDEGGTEEGRRRDGGGTERDGRRDGGGDGGGTEEGTEAEGRRRDGGGDGGGTGGGRDGGRDGGGTEATDGTRRREDGARARVRRALSRARDPSTHLGQEILWTHTLLDQLRVGQRLVADCAVGHLALLGVCTQPL